MSLILDALKRSEQERANNRHNPAVNVDIADNSNLRNKRFPWTVLLVVLFLLAAAIIVFLLTKNEPVKINQEPIITESQPDIVTTTPFDADKTQDSTKIQQPAEADLVPLTPPLLEAQTKSRGDEPVPLSQQAIRKPKPVKKSSAVSPSTTTEKTVAKKQGKTTSESVTEEKAATSPETVEEEKQATETATAPSLSELPDDDQMMFLNYEINTHFYSSKPGKSFTLINMKKYREGQMIDGSQMRIQNITAEGVVIDYGEGTVLLRSY